MRCVHRARVEGNLCPCRLLTPSGLQEKYSLGQGAGFYVDATEGSWQRGFKMYSYVAEELPAAVEAGYGVGADDNKSIFGHRCVVGRHRAPCAPFGFRRGIALLANVTVPRNESLGVIELLTADEWK